MERIIVVDDDEAVLNHISKALRVEGYVVDAANTGRKAIEYSERSFYNLALIDIRLPDMEGTNLLTALKETTPKMIKIMLTGYPALQNAIEAVNKGADAYITKPVKMEELIKTVREQLRKQQQEMIYSQAKVAEYIQTRAKELEAKEEDFSEKKKT